MFVAPDSSIDRPLIENVGFGVSNSIDFSRVPVTTISCNRPHTVARPTRGIGVYPNPSTGVVDVTFNNESSGAVEVSVVDVYGKTLFVSQENLKIRDTRLFTFPSFGY